MPKIKKNCANCLYGVKTKVLGQMQRICVKRSKLNDGEIMLVADDCKCKNWLSGKEYNRQVEEQETVRFNVE